MNSREAPLSSIRIKPGLVQNWPVPMVTEPTRPSAISSGARGQRGLGDDHRIDAAHLGEDGDGTGTASGDIVDGAAAAQAAGEADRFNAIVLRQPLTDINAAALQHGESPAGKPCFRDRCRNRLREQLGRSRMARVRLDDDGAAGRQGRGAVPAGDGERRRGSCWRRKSPPAPAGIASA